jgi:tripartite-type tricarboxylate transporter receptor subunit TctC
MSRIGRRRLIAAASSLALPAIAHAQTDWPNRPVRIIIPYAAGGGTDFTVRNVAERLSRQTGQQFVVEHRGGAAGALGTEAVVKAPPDGYTMLMTPQAPIQLLPHLRKLPYDVNSDLVVVGRMAEQIAGFAVHPSVGVTTLKDFVELARRNPGKFSFGTAGVGSVNHLRVETLKLMAGIDLLHVPYRGVGEALPDLLAGVIHMMVDSNVLPAAKAGKLTLISVLTQERYSEFPEVMTMKEQGFPDYDVPVWFGAYFASGVPRPIIEKAHREIATIHTDKEFQDKLFAGGSFVYREALSLPDMQAHVARQSARFADLIKRANIKLD